MYRYINGEYAYGLINYYADIVLIISCLLCFKLTRHSLSLYAKYIVFSISKSNTKLAKTIEIILVSVQSFIIAEACIISARANVPFGELVGTGACGKGYKEWVKTSVGGPYLKVRVKLG